VLQLSESQSMLRPAGPAAGEISTLGWAVFITFLVVAFVMWLLFWWLAVRRRGSVSDHAPVEPEGGHSWIFVGGVGIPVAVLTTFFIWNLDTMGSFPIHKDVDPPPQIRVIGHQWWWEVRYISGSPQDQFATANEIHIPVGEDVDVELISGDVAHSFWIPRLNGKEDLIPGQPNEIRLRADQPGVYRGECAEYCGAQHAHMIVLVVAQPPDEYQAWMAHQREPAATPQDDQAKTGQQIFLSAACAFCHAIRGTGAAGGVAPDLTHLASRRGLAANTLVNDTADLEAWVTHAQAFKPEVGMPDLTQFSGADLKSLTAYLQELK
jgi:cytochrome c oxidase subunit 2